MQFKLINQINPNYTATEQILTNRGINHSQIQHYLNTTDKDITPPEAFGENLLKTAAALVIQTVQSEKQMAIIVDCDCDGYTSSAILINYLYSLFPSYVERNLSYFVHDSKTHGLSDTMNWLSNRTNLGLVILPDSSSNDYAYHKNLKDAGINVLVLDHHDADHVSEYALVINNQLSDYPNKELSGAGVTWQFCRYIDKLLNINNAEKYRDLVALGLDADMMSLRSIQTKHLIGTGLASPRNPFIVKMAERNDYSLKGKLTPIGVAFYIAPFVNAMTRSGSIEQKQLLFESMLEYRAFDILPSTKRGHSLGQTETLVDQAIRVATNVKNRQTKVQDECMQKIEHRIIQEDLLSHKVLLFLMEPGEVDRNVAGLVANKIMSKYQRPVCILTAAYPQDTPPWIDTPFTNTTEEVIYSGSARGCDKTGLHDFKSICLETGICNYAEGHPGAFGLSIDGSKVQTFIQKTDELLADMNDQAIYFVDYIYQGDNINPTNILDIAQMEDLWGKDMPQSLVAIKNLTILPNMVAIYDKKGYTIKISLQNNISLMLFHAKEEDCQKLQNYHKNIVINVIGKCNKNEWMGNISPQIFIEQYEIINQEWTF